MIYLEDCYFEIVVGKTIRKIASRSSTNMMFKFLLYKYYYKHSGDQIICLWNEVIWIVFTVFPKNKVIFHWYSFVKSYNINLSRIGCNSTKSRKENRVELHNNYLFYSEWLLISFFWKRNRWKSNKYFEWFFFRSAGNSKYILKNFKL